MEPRRTKVPPPPSEDTLREAALASLARRSMSTSALNAALHRRVESWARAARARGDDESLVLATIARAHEIVAGILTRFQGNGLLDDAAFAEHRAARLARNGRSRRAIAADLTAKGIDADTVRTLRGDEDDELAAAVAFARRRRFGPFARGEASPELRRKWLSALGRAGYSFGIADRALNLARGEAEAVLFDRSSGLDSVT